MPLCNRCGGFKQLPSDQCECGILSADLQQLPVAEAAPGLSDEMLTFLSLLQMGESREFCELAFGGGRTGAMRVQYMLAFLCQRGLAVNFGITERGRELMRIYAKGAA